MANNALASGSVVVTANADPMAAGLADAERKAEQSFHKTQKTLDKATKKWFKHEGGFLGAVGGGLLGDLGFGGLAGIGIGSILAAQQLGKLWNDVTGYSKSFNEELQRTQRWLDDIEKQMSRVAKVADEWRTAMVSPADKLADIEQEMALLHNRGEALRNDFKQAGAEMKALKEMSFAGFGRWVIGVDKEIDAAAKGKMEAFGNSLERVRDRFRDLEEAKKRLLDPTKDPALMGEFERMMKQMGDSIVQLGMKPWEKALMDKFEGKLPDEKIKQFKELGIAADLAAEKFKEAEEHAKELVNSAAPMFERMVNIATSVGKALDKSSWNLSGLFNQPKDLYGGAISAGSKEAYSMIIKSQFAGMGVGKSIEDANRENGRKIDDVKRAVERGIADVVKAMAEIGAI